jgi:hypothetical protein
MPARLPDYYFDRPEDRNLPPLTYPLIVEKIDFAYSLKNLDNRLSHLKRAFVSINGLFDINYQEEDRLTGQLRRQFLGIPPEPEELLSEFPQQDLDYIHFQANLYRVVKIGLAGFIKHTQRERDSNWDDGIWLTDTEEEETKPSAKPSAEPEPPAQPSLPPVSQSTCSLPAPRIIFGLPPPYSEFSTSTDSSESSSEDPYSQVHYTETSPSCIDSSPRYSPSSPEYYNTDESEPS